ncbi:hypothetical protein BST81_00430 [Leptolyngbya sp. 'hensonii']|uniref:hypothetical protein n=1 Tax=Leptolyngbya sp. 'hensonii' TaxID=1922337 RepID=UPI00094F5B90|nr:hypothetical protein [Leptolyngbya sp. 'hensonii']OLP20245.1 hypothetical protein BST81_00430 [Leptolyngbya sp. 'hensonii']
MTSKLLAPERPVSTVGVSVNNGSHRSDRLVELTKSLYKTDHQLEFMHLRAEAEALLQEVQVMKQQRLSLTISLSDQN